MNFMASGLVLWGALLVGGQAHADPMTNETLFENCKTFVAIGDAAGSTEQQRLAAIQCAAYIGGAVQLYNFENIACKMDSLTNRSIINDYLDFTRKTGGLSNPAALVVHSLLADCYCTNPQDSIFKPLCPAPLPPRQ